MLFVYFYHIVLFSWCKLLKSLVRSFKNSLSANTEIHSNEVKRHVLVVKLVTFSRHIHVGPMALAGFLNTAVTLTAWLSFCFMWQWS